jgi:SAM-dependent methyltransferase
MYFPLHTLPAAQAALDRRWPNPVADVLKQQVTEPFEERRYRDSIPRVTAIGDATSIEVQRQYEENPYPRWVYAASAPTIPLNDQLRAAFPSVPFRPLEKDDVDILVAGCGTGRHPIEVARLYANSRVLALDLSLSSLCYAKRKTPPDVAGRIEYAQGDILETGTFDRSFDMIDSTGVLHHMADPFAAWRTLLKLLRPNGFMRVGLYSEIARRNVSINAARAFIKERGYASTADDIRRCRQDLLSSPLKSVATTGDFFSTSECRDLLFHVQERQLTIPDIKSFIAANGLKFIGFEFKPDLQQHYRQMFSRSGWQMTDLDRWHDLEVKNPDLFILMYQFWVQKA